MFWVGLFSDSSPKVWIRSSPLPLRFGCTAFGPGLIAEDLPDLLPGVFRHLYARK